MSNTVTAVPHVLQNDYLSVVLNGRSYPMSRNQPTFKQMKAALEKGKWNLVPKLISLAAQVAEKSHGRVDVRADGVYYKGVKVDNSITAKIFELIDHSKPVAHLLRFMDNLYQQPDVNTVNEVYEWLSNGRFALTDDGCFLAYKRVKADYTDCHTGTVDNHVGQRPLMPRSEVDPNRNNECSRGYHFCSKNYLTSFGGDRIMEVKVNPADVVAIPRDYQYSKGRCWTYEVMREVEPGEMIEGETDTPVMMQPVIEYAKERTALIRQVKALPTVKRLMKNGKLRAASFSKASTPRLRSWLQKFTRMDIAPTKSKLFDNPLRFAREAAGLTIGQVARAADMELKDVYNAERAQSPSQEAIDKVLKGIAKAQGITRVAASGISYPRPSSSGKRQQAPAPVPVSASAPPSDTSSQWDDDDEEWDYDEDEDSY